MSKDLSRYILGLVIVVCAVALFVLLLLVDVPLNIKDPLMIAFGIFTAKFQTVVDYFFGSSEGSRDKTKMLDKKDG